MGLEFKQQEYQLPCILYDNVASIKHVKFVPKYSKTFDIEAD